MTAPTRLILVRHGEAAAGWGADRDPGLSDRGRAQAEAAAEALAPLGPLPVVVSPLRRTRETAGTLARTWGVSARVDPAVGEIRAAVGDLAERATWLSRLLSTPWAAWPAEQQAWQRSVVDALLGIAEDSVVVTHFVAITVAVGDQGYLPDYCSRTVLEHDGVRLRLVEQGQQRATVVR